MTTLIASSPILAEVLARRSGGGIVRLIAVFGRAVAAGEAWALGIAALAAGLIGWKIYAAVKAA